jgi:tRNA pseudouridine38-40 synthase
MSTRRIKLIVQYDGADYHGWQVQPGQRTIQGQLSEAVSSLVGEDIIVQGASRTDAGVSALGQAATFDVVDCPIPTENFRQAVNDRLPDDIVVTEAVETTSEFDVSSDAKSKLYRYTIYTGPFRPVLDIRHCWHIPAKLDIGAMYRAAQYLLGEHDFKSFASAKDTRENSVRTIFRCDVTNKDEWIYVDVEGNRFLYNMVRNITGSLVEVGIGRWQADKMKDVLEAKDRTAAGPIAPSQGLCLMKVEY